VPVGESETQQLKDRGLEVLVVLGERLTIVEQLDLKSAPSGQVDVPNLDPPPGHIDVTLGARPDRAQQPVGIKKKSANLGKVLHHFCSWATTTTINNATSASGIRSRR
jgi:hypothetical protein